MRTWLHAKTGRRYIEIGRGPLSVSAGPGLQENDRVVAYRPEAPAGEDIYFRGEREFDDGRFVLLDSRPDDDGIAVKVDVIAAADAGHRLDEARGEFIKWVLHSAFISGVAGNDIGQKIVHKAIDLGVARKEHYDSVNDHSGRPFTEPHGTPWIVVMVTE